MRVCMKGPAKGDPNKNTSRNILIRIIKTVDKDGIFKEQDQKRKSLKKEHT